MVRPGSSEHVSGGCDGGRRCRFEESRSGTDLSIDSPRPTWNGIKGFALGIACVFVVPASVFAILYSIPVSGSTFATLETAAFVVGGIVALGPLIYLVFRRQWPIAVGYAVAAAWMAVVQLISIA